MTSETPAQADYWQWQEELERVFMAGSEHPQPFALFLDDEETSRLWPGQQRPSASLSSAVSARIDWTSSNPFGPLAEVAARWRRGRQQAPPPTLPLLAVTVLAASQMHRDADASASAYFLRLAQLLRPAAEGEHLKELRHRLSAGFDPVAAMWRSLDAWVCDRSASLGASTIRADHHLTRIGYPLSQALVRGSDRLRLTAFFDAAQVLERGLPEPGAVLQYLKMWASRPRGLSQSLQRALADPSCDVLLGSYIWRLASSWDGLVRTAEGRRRLDLRVVLDLEELAARWAIPVIDGIDQETLAASGGGTVTIFRQQGGSLYRLDGALPTVADGIRTCLKLTGRSCSATAEQGPVLALREDPDAGGWLSARSVQPFDEHLLAAHPALREELETALREAAEPGWRALPQRPTAAVLPGWVLYRSVRFTDAGALDRALRRVSPTLVQALRPDSSLRPRLASGLPLARELGRGHYLSGGEPDLILPVGTEQRYVEASLDGQSQSPPFLATGFPIELRRYGPMAPGRHELRVDGDLLVFFVHDGAEGQSPSQGGLAWPANSGYRLVGPATADPSEISGAFVAGASADPILVKRGTTAWLITRNGQAAKHSAPDLAPPALGRDMPAPYYFEVVPDTEHVWLVETRAGQVRPPTLLRWAEPYFAAVDPTSEQLWRLLELAPPPQEATLWKLYLGAWRRWAA